MTLLLSRPGSVAAVAALGLTTLVWFACGCGTQRWPDKAVAGGGGVESDGFAMSSPSVVLEERRPGLVFGTAAAPGQPVTFGYFIVLKLPPGRLAEAPFAPRSTAHAGQNELSASLELELFGVTLEVDHRLEIDRQRNRVGPEFLSVSGRTVDVSAGRLILLDLTVTPPCLEQRRMQFPALEADPKRIDDVERVGSEVLCRAEALFPELRRFLKQ